MKKSLWVLFLCLVLFVNGCGQSLLPQEGDDLPVCTESPAVEPTILPEETPASNSDEIADEEVSPDTDAQKVDTANKIPWGFAEESYALYKSGVLDQFIPLGSEVDQCVIADLDMDGTDDVLLSISIPDSVDPDNIHNYAINTLIIKGLGDNNYKVIVENPFVNYFSSYDCSSKTTAGTGWFKFTRARGTAGGYEYNYLFRYDKDRADWFYSEYYYNRYGYIEAGISCVQTPANFGDISFTDFWRSNEYGQATKPYEDLSVDENNFRVSVSQRYITLQDRKKENEVNKLIVDDIKFFIDNLRLLNVNVDINLFGGATFETPEIISIEYQVFGTIDSDKLNYSGANRKYFTTMIDINSAKRIALSDIIDVDQFIRIIENDGFSEDWVWSSSETKAKYSITPEADLVNLLKSSDELAAVFSGRNTGIFCAIHEKSLCLYFQQEFFGLGPECEEPKLYVPIESVLPYVKLNYWANASEAASHIIWTG